MILVSSLFLILPKILIQRNIRLYIDNQFEGGDQAGKKTQSAMLQRKLRSAKLKVKLFAFPDYSTPIGKEIDRYLHGKRKYPAQVIHCLLAANQMGEGQVMYIACS